MIKVRNREAGWPRDAAALQLRGRTGEAGRRRGAQGLALEGCRGQERAQCRAIRRLFLIVHTIVFVALFWVFIPWFYYTAVREWDLYISISWKFLSSKINI